MKGERDFFWMGRCLKRNWNKDHQCLDCRSVLLEMDLFPMLKNGLSTGTLCAHTIKARPSASSSLSHKMGGGHRKRERIEEGS